MSIKKDKQKVLGENFDDERIKQFLIGEPPVGVNEDFHLLERAYRGMIPENFQTFVTFFIESGRDISATNPEGKSLLSLIQSHRHGEDYLNTLIKAGAN